MTDEKPTVTFDWADLPAEETVTQGYVHGTRIDVTEEVPEVLRDKIEKNLEEYLAQTPDNKGKKSPVWRRQACGTKERADEMIRLVKRYGNYRPKDIGGMITVRAVHDAGDPQHGKPADPTAVRYCATPKQRRKPKTEKPKPSNTEPAPAPKSDPNPEPKSDPKPGPKSDQNPAPKSGPKPASKPTPPPPAGKR